MLMLFLKRPPAERSRDINPRDFQLLLFSAKTAAALQEVTKGFVEYIKSIRRLA